MGPNRDECPNIVTKRPTIHEDAAHTLGLHMLVSREDGACLIECFREVIKSIKESWVRPVPFFWPNAETIVCGITETELLMYASTVSKIPLLQSVHIWAQYLFPISLEVVESSVLQLLADN